MDNWLSLSDFIPDWGKLSPADRGTMIVGVVITLGALALVIGAIYDEHREKTKSEEFTPVEPAKIPRISKAKIKSGRKAPSKKRGKVTWL
jgi:hypothetical protein